MNQIHADLDATSDKISIAPVKYGREGPLDFKDRHYDDTRTGIRTGLTFTKEH